MPGSVLVSITPEGADPHLAYSLVQSIFRQVAMSFTTNLSASVWASRFVAKLNIDESRGRLVSNTSHRYRPGRFGSSLTRTVYGSMSGTVAPCAIRGPISHPKANQGLAARETRGIRSAMSERAFSSRTAWSLNSAASLVKATNLLAVVSLSVDLKNRANEQFRREFFDCETNSVRRPRKAPISKSLIHGFAAPRREQLRSAAIEISHGALGPGIFV